MRYILLLLSGIFSMNTSFAGNASHFSFDEAKMATEFMTEFWNWSMNWGKAMPTRPRKVSP